MNYIDIALSYNHLLTINEFIEETKYNIDAFTIDRFWSNLNEDMPLYLDENLLQWCGFIGEERYRKKSLARVLSGFVESVDYWVFTNDEYLEWHSGHSNITNYPHPDNFKGKGKSTIKHIILTVTCFKELIMILHTKKAKQVRRYYLELERLYFTYTKYTVMFRERQIKCKDTKIDLLIMQMSDIIKENKIQTHKIDIQTKNLERVLQLNEDIAEKLDIATDERAPKSEDVKKHEMFILMQLNNRRYNYAYYVLCRQKESIQDGLDNILKRHPNASEALRIEYQPNSKNLFQLIKDGLRSSGKVSVRYNNIDLGFVIDENGERRAYTHDEFIEDIKQLDADKKLVPNKLL